MSDTEAAPCTPCKFCGGPNLLERVELGLEHCKASACVQKHLIVRKQNLRFDLAPKVGFVFSFIDDPTALTIGKSSGRS